MQYDSFTCCDSLLPLCSLLQPLYVNHLGLCFIQANFAFQVLIIPIDEGKQQHCGPEAYLTNSFLHAEL